MMISPEAYYEEYLRGKTPAQIKTAIRGLKQKVGHLKNELEDPQYHDRVHASPDERTQLDCNIMYLERAKQALEESGEKYEPSRAESRAAELDASTPYVCRLEFSIGSFFAGWETRTALLESNNFHISGKSVPGPMDRNPCDFLADREEFLDELQCLHLGEWRHSYDLSRYGMAAEDGTQWELKLYFSDGHRPVSFEGSNAYPYNFEDLRSLLCQNTRRNKMCEYYP